MKKSIYQLKLYWKRFVRYADYIRYSFFGKTTPEAIIKILPSRIEPIEYFLERLERFMRTRFTYKVDNIDFAKHPYTFFDEGLGDCDDYALFALWVMRLIYPEVESNIMMVFREGEGHAVCIIKTRDGNYYHISNWGIIGGFNSFNNIASNIFPDFKSWWIVNYNLTIIDYKN